MGDDLRPEAVARGLFESSPDMCYAIDRDGRLVWWNAQVRETTGYDDSTLDGLAVFELLPPEQQDDAQAAFEHTDSFPDEVSLTFDLVTSDGERIPHEFNGTRLEVDGRTVIVGIGRDVSNRRERERELERIRDFFREAERLGDLGAWEFDAGGEAVWTDGTRRIHGVDEEFTPTVEDGIEFYHPEDREKIETAVDEALETGEPYDVEARLITVDGEERWVRTRGAPIDDDTIRGYIQDITARRETEQALRRQRDELDRLNRISETVYEVIQAVTDAATRESIEEVTCERLADCELYQAVWIGRNDYGDDIEPRAGLGNSEDFLEVVDDLNDVDWRRPARVAIETGEAQVLQRISESDLPAAAKAAAARLGIESGISMPIVHGERVEGVLSVYSSRPDRFNEREREALRRLGSVIGFAIHAVHTERLILSETATELTFRTTAPDGLLASISERADGPCYREWSAPTESGNYRHYITVHGLDADTVVDLLEDRPTVESVGHIGSGGEEDVFEVVTTDSLVRRLLEVGASTTDVVSEDGESTVVAEIPGEVDTRPIVEAAEEMYNTELISKRSLDRQVRTADEFRDPVTERLTDRQQAALKHAYFSGYFSWPREANAEDVAEAMGISSPTLHYHLRRAQETLVEAYLQYVE